MIDMLRCAKIIIPLVPLGLGMDQNRDWRVVYLETDDRVDSAPKGGGNSMRGKPEWAKEGREGGEEGCAWALLTHHHTCAHTRQAYAF